MFVGFAAALYYDGFLNWIGPVGFLRTHLVDCLVLYFHRVFCRALPVICVRAHCSRTWSPFARLGYLFFLVDPQRRSFQCSSPVRR